MKNKTKNTTPADLRRSRPNHIHPPRPAGRTTTKAPNHDLLVLSFYPGMGRKKEHPDHPTAA